MTPEQYRAKYGDAKIMVIPKKAIDGPMRSTTAAPTALVRTSIQPGNATSAESG